MTATSGRTRADDLPWLTVIKAIAIAWIFLNHVGERIFGYPYFANPAPGWPPFHDRLLQLAPLDGYGLLSIPLNLFRYAAWTGDQGVQLFLLASGFGLTWGLLRAGRTDVSYYEFLRKRAWRILPLWWGAHLLVLAGGILAGKIGLDSGTFWRSFFGLRLTPEDVYALSASWWYIGLLLQLYLVFPLLYRFLLRAGPLRFLTVVLAVSFTIRAIGLLTFDAYLDAWSRGAVFITRLPEFAAGMALALLFRRDPVTWTSRLRSPAAVVLAAGVYAAGSLFALSLAGMTVAPFLLGGGAFVLLCTAFLQTGPLRGVLGTPVRWTGDHSYGLFLVHGFPIAAFIPSGLDPAAASLAVRIFAAIAATVLGAVLLEAAVHRVEHRISLSVSRHGTGRTIRATMVVVVLLLLLPAAGEVTLRAVNPQEVLGWGERPALEPHGRYGWRLIPDQTTLLRWESYAYTVQANALGFPGPLYPTVKDSGTLRILVTGDAFTSAEGVETGRSWPRLLEQELSARAGGMPTEILNFAMTGYGPNQYAAVLEEQIPAFTPDLVIVELFVNDFQDVLTTTEDFHRSIGFDLPAGDSPEAFLRFTHAGTWFRRKIFRPLVARLRSQPSPPYGYTLGNFFALERAGPVTAPGAADSVANRLLEIRDCAAEHGARVLLVLVPAPVQVCPPGHLAYYPTGLDLADTARFDTELPQREMRAIANRLGLPLLDLRSALQHGSAECPYQPRNMHWTEAGHRRVAAVLLDAVEPFRRSLPAGGKSR